VNPVPDIRVSIITGFLGAGKSTLLNRLLKDPQMKDTAVIINEFGSVGIDHMLVEASSDGIIELSDGCLCCTVRGELTDTLANLVDGVQSGRIARLQRIVIETTGLADPAQVLQAILGHPVLAQNLKLDGLITVVDAVHGLSTLDNHEEAVRQVAVADRLVLSKQTMADAKVVETLLLRLKDLNPRATVLDADSSAAGAAGLLNTGLFDPATKTADVGRWLMDEDSHDHDHSHAHNHEHGHEHGHGHTRGHTAHHHHHDVNRHDARIRSFSILHDKPIDRMAIDMFIDLLRSAHGDKLLRMKAIVALSDNPDRPLVLHGVQTIFHRPERLAAWPDPSDRRTRMVLITKDLPESFVTELFDAFTGKPAIDRPDRMALQDNPLAIAGLKF
jgi:G3E family GTPase